MRAAPNWIHAACEAAIAIIEAITFGGRLGVIAHPATAERLGCALLVCISRTLLSVSGLTREQ